MNWCFGGVATAAAVVQRVLDAGGVITYVFLLVVYLERAIFVDLCSLCQCALVICTAHEQCRTIVMNTFRRNEVYYRRRDHRLVVIQVDIVAGGCWRIELYLDIAAVLRSCSYDYVEHVISLCGPPTPMPALGSK